MATKVALVGGPCDGQTRSISQATLDAGHLTCKGATYTRLRQVQTHGLITFGSNAPTPSHGGGSGSGPDTAAQALGGWADVRRTTNQTIPSAVRRMRATQNAALRELRHGRKVKR